MCRTAGRRSGFLSRMRRELDFTRTSPEPGADADSVSHEFVARFSLDQPRATLEVGGIATVWELHVDGMPMASGQSMFERQVVALDGLAPGDHEVRIVVHPLTELLDSLP